MTMIAGERIGRGVRRPVIPTPETPSYEGGLCVEPEARKDWRTTDLDNPKQQRRLADEYCEACPIATACLEGALARDETAGVWGGLVAAELVRARDLKLGRKPRRKTTPAPAVAEVAEVAEPDALGVAA